MFSILFYFPLYLAFVLQYFHMNIPVGFLLVCGEKFCTLLPFRSFLILFFILRWILSFLLSYHLRQHDWVQRHSRSEASLLSKTVPSFLVGAHLIDEITDVHGDPSVPFHLFLNFFLYFLSLHHLVFFLIVACLVSHMVNTFL